MSEQEVSERFQRAIKHIGDCLSKHNDPHSTFTLEVRQIAKLMEKFAESELGLSSPPSSVVGEAEKMLAEALEVAINTVECNSLGIDSKGNKFELPWYQGAKKALKFWRDTKPSPTEKGE